MRILLFPMTLQNQTTIVRFNHYLIATTLSIILVDNASIYHGLGRYNG